VREPKPKKKKIKDDAHTLEMQVLPGDPSKAHIIGWDYEPVARNQKVVKRDLENPPALELSAPTPPIDNITGLPLDIPAAQAAIGDSVGEWDCTPQGLAASSSGRGRFSMGGGQDSTYEYFPKVCISLNM
jgi:mannosyl-oligosaccharide alpha-1,2-mannosidase